MVKVTHFGIVSALLISSIAMGKDCGTAAHELVHDFNFGSYGHCEKNLQTCKFSEYNSGLPDVELSHEGGRAVSTVVSAKNKSVNWSFVVTDTQDERALTVGDKGNYKATYEFEVKPEGQCVLKKITVSFSDDGKNNSSESRDLDASKCDFFSREYERQKESLNKDDGQFALFDKYGLICKFAMSYFPPVHIPLIKGVGNEVPHLEH